MKATLNIHDTLPAEAKSLASQQHLNLTSLIQEGLRMRIRATDLAPANKGRDIPIFNGKTGLAPGVSGLRACKMLDAADYPQDKSLLVLLPAA
jgi:hypothetical protein